MMVVHDDKCADAVGEPCCCSFFFHVPDIDGSYECGYANEHLMVLLHHFIDNCKWKQSTCAELVHL